LHPFPCVFASLGETKQKRLRLRVRPFIQSAPGPPPSGSFSPSSCPHVIESAAAARRTPGRFAPLLTRRQGHLFIPFASLRLGVRPRNKTHAHAPSLKTQRTPSAQEAVMASVRSTPDPLRLLASPNSRLSS